MTLKIEMLRVFVTVAEEGHLARAADRLGRTQSAVSMILSQVEAELGAALFQSGRKSHLTPLGEMVFEEATRALAEHDRSLGRISGYARAVAGHIRIAATPSIASTVLPPIVATFLAAHPQVTLDMRDMDSNTVLHAIENDEADIGIATAPQHSIWAQKKLFSDPFGLVCRGDHPLATARAPGWEDLRWPDLANVPFISNGLCHLIQDAQFTPIAAAARISAPSTSSLLGLIRAGVGVTVLPRLAVPEDLVFLPLRDTAAVREVHLMAGPRRMQLPHVKAFVTLLERAKFR